MIGPLLMCSGTYLLFQTTYYLNGNNFIEIELRRQGVAFREDDNAFLATSDSKALQESADAHGVAGKINSVNTLYLVIESVKLETKHERRSTDLVLC